MRREREEGERGRKERGGEGEKTDESDLMSVCYTKDRTSHSDVHSPAHITQLILSDTCEWSSLLHSWVDQNQLCRG